MIRGFKQTFKQSVVWACRQLFTHARTRGVKNSYALVPTPRLRHDTRERCFTTVRSTAVDYEEGVRDISLLACA
jgi:hypothetical protein